MQPWSASLRGDSERHTARQKRHHASCGNSLFTAPRILQSTLAGGFRTTLVDTSTPPAVHQTTTNIVVSKTGATSLHRLQRSTRRRRTHAVTGVRSTPRANEGRVGPSGAQTRADGATQACHRLLHAV